MTIRTRTATGS